MLPNCKQVAEQLSEHIDQPLTGVRWVKMKLHLALCAYCRLYGKQLEISSKTVQSLEQQKQPSEELCNNAAKAFREMHCNDDQQCNRKHK